jgi:hypothetical protein
VVLGRDVDLGEALEANLLRGRSFATRCVLEITLVHEKPKDEAKVEQAARRWQLRRCI